MNKKERKEKVLNIIFEKFKKIFLFFLVKRCILNLRLDSVTIRLRTELLLIVGQTYNKYIDKQLRKV